VGSQSIELHLSFVSHHKLPFILLSDKSNKVRNLYGVPSTFEIIAGRLTYIIDKEGIVRYIFSSQFQPEKHIEEAIKVVKALKTNS
jgi:peroxiredoxin Q/BCP